MKNLFIFMLIYISTISSFAQNDFALKQMIGQMVMVGFDEESIEQNSTIVNEINSYNLGGVILFDRFYHNKDKVKNIRSPQQLKKLTTDLKKYTKNNISDKLLIAIDQEGGKVQRLKPKYGFVPTPSAKEISTKNQKEAKQLYNKMADMLYQNGINCNLAPVVDLAINKNNYVIEGLERSYGSTPKDVVKYADIFINSLSKKNIINVLKHFPGHGSSSGDSHKGFVDITNTWQEIELEPYKQLISTNQIKMVMTAHVFNANLDPNYPATLSYKINTKLLREKLGYKGVIISDDLQMKAITKHYSLQETIKLAINSGVDILLFGNQLDNYDTKQIIDIIFDQVKRGEISLDRIIQSYNRIKKLKSDNFPINGWYN